MESGQRLHRIGLVAIIGAAAVRSLIPRLDPDFWWHLRAGLTMVATRAIPRRDPWSFTARGRPWLDHEWLAEAGMAGLWQTGGLVLLLVVFSIALAATLFLIAATSRRRGAGSLASVVTVGLASVSMLGSTGPRVQVLTLLFTALFAFILTRPERRMLFALPLLMIFWANLHGGFVIGIVLLLISLSKSLIERDRATAKRLGVVFALTFAATLINANGLAQLQYPLRFLMPNPFTNQIEEAGSPNFHLPVVIVFEALLLLLVAAALRGRKRLDAGAILTIVVFIHLALAASRNLALAAVVLTPFVAELLSGDGLIPQFQGAAARITKPVNPGLALVLDSLVAIGAAIALIVLTARELSPASLQKYDSGYPRAAIEKVALDGKKRLFTTYEWGGYALWSAPAVSVFIDPRADTVYDSAILNDYLHAWRGSEDWRAVLKRWSVDSVIVSPDAPLAQLLALDTNWRLVQRDQASVLYENTSH